LLNFGALHKRRLNVLDGSSFVRLLEAELKRQSIPKEKFYRESGVSSATMSQWRKNIYSPSSAKIKDIEQYLGVAFEIGQKETPTLSKEDERQSIMDLLDTLSQAELIELMAKTAEKLKERGLA
jgi:transcriptional regulator with XRE-family HTH domain